MLTIFSVVLNLKQYTQELAFALGRTSTDHEFFPWQQNWKALQKTTLIPKLVPKLSFLRNAHVRGSSRQ
jgi:hypothetical protein